MLVIYKILLIIIQMLKMIALLKLSINSETLKLIGNENSIKNLVK